MKLIQIAPFGLVAVLAAASVSAQVQTTRSSETSSVTVRSSQPAPVNYGPAPPFAQLDTNHDGRISREEANAYIPLFNDFDYLAHGANSISHKQFDNWNATQNRQ
jgi:hypothetical protein